MMLVILVFALVGMSLFGGGYRDVEVSQSRVTVRVRGERVICEICLVKAASYHIFFSRSLPAYHDTCMFVNRTSATCVCVCVCVCLYVSVCAALCQCDAAKQF